MADLRAWLSQALPGTLVPADGLAEALSASAPDVGLPGVGQQPLSWREQLWLAPPETRLGVAELLEALGRTRSWLYRHTGPRSPGPRIPHHKLEGELVFLVGEVRQWLLETETIVVPGRTAGSVGLLTLRRRQQGTRADAKGTR